MTNDSVLKAICDAVVLGTDENDIPVHLTPYEAAKAVKAYPEASWRPIAEADKSIVHTFDVAGLSIANSLPIWARDEDGRVYEALWSDNGKKAYWWDIEGESPVDPVEFMPHPLSPSTPS